MKGKEYLLQRCEDAVKTYFSTDDEAERIELIIEVDLLTDILEPEEIPLGLVLKLHHVLFDSMMKTYESKEIAFE